MQIGKLTKTRKLYTYPEGDDRRSEEKAITCIAKLFAALREHTNVNHKAVKRDKTISTAGAKVLSLLKNYYPHEIYEVIQFKCQEWMGTEFEKYLRPETLFGNKFAGYLEKSNEKRENYEK